jgi:hypothetical protein
MRDMRMEVGSRTMIRVKSRVTSPYFIQFVAQIWRSFTILA